MGLSEGQPIPIDHHHVPHFITIWRLWRLHTRFCEPPLLRSTRRPWPGTGIPVKMRTMPGATVNWLVAFGPGKDIWKWETHGKIIKNPYTDIRSNKIAIPSYSKWNWKMMTSHEIEGCIKIQTKPHKMINIVVICPFRFGQRSSTSGCCRGCCLPHIFHSFPTSKLTKPFLVHHSWSLFRSCSNV